MFKKIALVITSFAIAGCLLMLGLTIDAGPRPKVAPKVAPVAAFPSLESRKAPKLTAAEDNFISFSRKWLASYGDYSLDRFNKQAKGAGVVWQGHITSMDHTGTQFYLVPAAKPNDLTNLIGFEAIVTMKDGPYDARLRTPGTSVYITGHVRDVSTSGVIVDPLTIEIK